MQSNGYTPHKEYRYKYPKELGNKLKPGTDFHGKMVTMLLEYSDMSQGHMSDRYPEWDAINNTLTAFIPSDDITNIKKSTGTSPLIVPVSYAQLQTLLTYMMSYFMNDPIFKYAPVGGDAHDRIGNALLEHNVHIQTKKAKMGLNFHTFFRDSYSVGFGVMVPIWDVKKQMVIRTRDVKDTGLFSFGRNRTEEYEDERIIYEGNKLYNVDPYTFFPDPNVSISNIQEAEYYSYLERTSYLTLQRMEDQEDDPAESLFNVKYLRDTEGLSKYFYASSRTKEKKDSSNKLSNTNSDTMVKTVDVMHYFVDLIPSDLGLTRSDDVETWLFSLAGDKIIIDAHEVKFEHGLKPIVTGSPDMDGYSISPTSRLEMMFPLQDTMDWLFTSHIANVKKALNDVMVVDPKKIYMQDLMNPKPGKLIRLKKSAWGEGVEKAIQQLKVTDVTGSHMRDTGIITDMIKQASAASDIASGNVDRTGERVSATEASNAFQSSVGRIQKDAMLFSLQAFDDLGLMLGANTIQFMSGSYRQQLTGDWAEIYAREMGGKTFAQYDSTDLDIHFDSSVNDTNRLLSQGSVEAWNVLYGNLLKNPEVAQGFDMAKIFMHLARSMGANNVHQFIKQQDVQIRPNEEVAARVQSGELTPVGNV